MELKIENGKLKLEGVFQLIATGYFIGACVVFAPFFALTILVMLVAGAVSDGGAAGSWLIALMPAVMLPFILAMQAVMVGGMAVLGLWLYERRKPIRIKQDAEQQSELAR